MADWSALTKGFQQGSDWRQGYRAKKQLEQARTQELKGRQRALDVTEGNIADMQAEFPEETAGLGLSDLGQFDLQDPFGERMLNKLGGRIKRWRDQRRAARSAIPTASPADPTSMPVATPEISEEAAASGGAASDAQTYAVPDYADGGLLREGGHYADGPPKWSELTEAEKARYLAEQNRARSAGSVQNATQTVQGADRTAPRGPSRVSEAVRSGARATRDTLLDRASVPEGAGAGRRALNWSARALKKAPIIGALGATALEVADTDTEDYRKRFGLETDDPSLMGDIGVRTLGAMADLGSTMTFGAADRFYRDKQDQAAASSAPEAAPTDQLPAEDSDWGFDSSGSSGAYSSAPAPREALPTSQSNEPLDFSQVEIDPKDIPDMKLDDWKKYRRMVIRDATRRGQPIDQVQDRITQMQQKGFISYAQQGLALQQAGNDRGATAAYRAAFQYFPNGTDVEFGTMPGRDGRQIIVGVGIDEKTGKVKPGTQMIMDPERVSTLIENFSNPQAFRAWTKDWRDFQQKERKYEEVEKPLAQGQLDYMANNSEANILRAANAALRAGGGAGGLDGADRRAAEQTFRRRVENLIMEFAGSREETQKLTADADYLASIMSMVKVQNPQVPDNTVVQAIMQAYRDGTLAERLARMGVSGDAAPAPAAAPAQRTALPPASPTRAASPPPRAIPSPQQSAPSEVTGPPPGFPDVVWRNALRANGGNAQRAYESLMQYNDYEP